MDDRGKQIKSRWELVGLAFELGYIIALPLLLLILAGKYLDERFNTHPYFKLAGLLLAITTTTVWLARKFSEIFKHIRSPDDSHKDT